jgi:ATP-dependent exoDNAse (exonuclease V) alpha subunit
MASKDLFKYIEQSVDRRQAKIVIFIGDEYQLLPVEGGHNPVYKLNYRYKLTEVVRQASDNPIIQLASEIRKDIEHQKFRSATELLQLFRKFEGTNIIIPKDKNEFFNLLFTDIENKDKFISTYTNEAMKNYNYFCRNIVKNQPKDDYIVGDEVVFLEHHSVGDDIIHVNNEIVKIQKCNKVEYFLAPTIKYWECQDEGGEWFNVVANDSSYEWNKFLNQLSQYAKTAPKDKKREAWKDFFGHKNFMSKVAFTYAGTVHKSQGSSFDEGYVDVDEILRAWKYQESDMIFRLLYVACTRPKDKLILKINI